MANKQSQSEPPRRDSVFTLFSSVANFTAANELLLANYVANFTTVT
jgi:hypothetical protein